DGTVLVLGGTVVFNGEVGGAAGYDPARNTWSYTFSRPQVRRRDDGGPVAHTTTRLSSGNVLRVGGVSSTQAEQYDAAANTWFPVAALPSARWSHTASLLPDGRVLVAGGISADVGYTARVALYDPYSDIWSAQEISPAVPDADPTFSVRGMYIRPLNPR